MITAFEIDYLIYFPNYEAWNFTISIAIKQNYSYIGSRVSSHTQPELCEQNNIHFLKYFSSVPVEGSSVVVHFDSAATIHSSSARHPLYSLLIIKLSPYSGIGAITTRWAILFEYQTRVRSSVDLNRTSYVCLIPFRWRLAR